MPASTALLSRAPPAPPLPWFRSDDRFSCTPGEAGAGNLVRCPPLQHHAHHMQLVKPIRWLHVPKSGTSFANVLVPLACPPDSLPPWAAIVLDQTFITSAATGANTPFESSTPDPGAELYRWFPTCFPDVVPARCPGLAAEWSFSGHVPLSQNESEHMSRYHYFAMLRDPVRRLISVFNHPGRRRNECRTCRENVSIYEFAAHHLRSSDRSGSAGCATKMLVGRACQSTYPSRSELAEAARRLQRFTYVGDTDDWEASVCRANGMFGRPTYAAALGNARRGNYNHAKIDSEVEKLRAAAVKGGYFDWADDHIYRLAKSLRLAPLSDRAVRRLNMASQSERVPRLGYTGRCTEDVRA